MKKFVDKHFTLTNRRISFSDVYVILLSIRTLHFTKILLKRCSQIRILLESEF